MKTYRVGTMNTTVGGGNRRPLYCVETGDTIDMVTSDAGPALIGDMTEQQARRRFPEAFADAERRHSDYAYDA